MYIDGIVCFKYKIFTSLCLIFLLVRFILIVDSAQPGNPSSSRQMCSKLQSMLSYGKYHTSQISSNITYTSRIYIQNFLAYSSIDDLLLFIQPKHQINVYNARNIQLLANLSTPDVVIATSTTSLVSDSRHDLYFVYETTSATNLISLRVCQVHFNMLNLNFENDYCIETIKLQYDQTDLRINGLTIKRDHAGTKKSLLFMSTDVGLIYTIFDTNTGSLVGVSTIMNETLNEGSIVLSSSGSIFYASKQEHLIYELHVSRDFRLRYGKIIKTNAIKYPFGLITDECNHLYIASRSMILVMFVQTRSTIRSVFSKASDLPITLERVNASTYIYATIRKNSGKTASPWMFNILYFTEPEKVTFPTKYPVPALTITFLSLSSVAVRWDEKLDFNNTAADNETVLILWAVSHPLASRENTTKKYLQFSSTYRQPSPRFMRKISNKTRTTIYSDQDRSSIDENKLFTPSPSTKEYIPDLSDIYPLINPDDNLEIDDSIQFESLEQINPPSNGEAQSETHLEQDKSSDSYSFPSTLTPSLNRTIDVAGTLFSENDIQSYLEGRGNLSSNQKAQIQAYLAKQSSPSYVAENTTSNSNSVNRTIDISEAPFSEDDLQSYLEGKGNFTSNQKTQIQIYLAKQSSYNYTIFSRYSNRTKPATGIHVFDDNMQSTPQDDKYLFSNYSTKHPLSDSDLYSEYLHHLTDSNETFISKDDFKSYLEGRSNLSAIQKTQIQASLARVSSSYYNIFSKYSNSTAKPSGIVLPDEKPLSESSSNETSLFNEDSPFQKYLKQLNRTTGTNGILFSADDLKSYLQSRGNLSRNQEQQIQAFLARQPTFPYHLLFPKYTPSTRKPRTTLMPGHTREPESRRDGNQSLSEDTQSEDYSDELLPFDPTLNNRTTDSKQRLFTDDDLKSYLEGRGNLSKNQEAQIQAFLARQPSFPYHHFPKYSTTTRKPRRTLMPGRTRDPESRKDGNQSFTEDNQSEDYSEELLPFDPTNYNRTTDAKEILFSDDDIESYLEGRGNLSRNQEAQIQAFLARQPSFPYHLFPKYSTSTRKPRRTLMPGRTRDPESRRDGNQSFTDDNQSEDYSEELLPFDPAHYNHTMESPERLFSDDDLKSYLQGRGNLLLAQKIQIQAYLARQSSFPYHLFSKYSTTTRKPRRTLMPGHTRKPESRKDGNLSFTEDNQSEDYSEELLPFDPTHYNRTTDSKEKLFSDDDIESYLEGRGNLSKNQEAQIQAFLARQPSFPYHLFPKYSTSTRKPRRTLMPGRTRDPESRRDGNLSSTEDNQAEDYSEELLPFDPTHYNHTAYSKERLFSDDDIESYLEGRGNLTRNQEAQIQAFLARQPSFPYHLFPKYSTSTRKPRRTLMPGRTRDPESRRDGNLSSTEDNQAEDYSEELLPFDPTHYNHTAYSKERLFSDDDIESYLEGRGNLTRNQEAQIQAFLARQPSFPYHLFPKYSTSTRKPRSTLMPGRTRDPESRRDGNQSLTDDNQFEDYSEELLPFDRTHYNLTTDSKEMLFSDDDIESYLEGRGNLTRNQEAQIQSFLARQPSFPYHLFSKYSTSTRKPRRTLIPGRTREPESRRDGNLSFTEGNQAEDYSEELLPFDPTHYNLTTDSKEMLFSHDDLKSYLQGRGNLSLAQKIQIQAFLARQSSFNNKTLSRYFSSIRKPNKTSTYDDKLQTYSEGQTNLSLSEQLQSSESASQKFASTISYTTRKRTGGRRPSQSFVNGSKNLDDSKEQLSDIYTEWNEDRNVSNDVFNDYSLLSTSTPINMSLEDVQVTVLSDVTKSEIDDPIHRRSTVLSPDHLTQDISNTNLASSTLSLNGLSIIEDHSLATQLKPTVIDEGVAVIPSIHQNIASLQNQSNLTNTSISSNDTMSSNVTFGSVKENTKDGISHKHSSSLSVDINVSSTPHPSSPLTLSSTTLLSSRRSRLSSPLHHSLSSSRTKSPKITRFSSSKLFSEVTKPTELEYSEVTMIDPRPTTVLSYSTLFPSSTGKLQSSHKLSSMQTTDATITSNIPKEKSVSTPPDVSSSFPFTTHYPRFKSTISSTSLPTTDEQIFTTKSDQYTSKFPIIHKETSSLPYVQSTRLFPTLVPSMNIDFSLTIKSDKTSPRSSVITTDEENRKPLLSTLSPQLRDKYQEGLITTQSSLELTSTIFPHFYKTKTSSTAGYVTLDRIYPFPGFTPPVMRRTSYSSTTSTITTTTERRYRTRKQKIIRWQTQQLSTTTTSSSTTTTTTTTPSYQTTSIHDYKPITSTQISIWHSEWNPLKQQEKIVIKPPLTKNGSNTRLANDLLRQIINNMTISTNSSSEKLIYFNLSDLPPSSWNLSLNSSDNIVLDIALPTPVYPSHLNTTTNLTFTNIQANRFSTNINGMPVNLQLDRVETKQFSLVLNATDNSMNRDRKIQHSSDVIIGHVKSEQFELNLTKSDNMHVHIQQVDSATAELYLDSSFCTNESSLEINLNLSKNGTIRYGNRKPIHIGPVFTRVHMLKQSCDREQPLTLFFDICERQNPCSNGGTCLSIMPDYNDISYIPTETGHIGYKCHCPLHISGEHCQYLQYPLGYCLNGGTLFQINDRFNKSIEKCICAIGFHGDHCEENIDNCIGIDCSDHGVCEDGIDTYKCSCFDGFYGFSCARANVQTVLLQAASRSFGVVAILLIAGIAGLVVASDIHTYLTRKQQKNSLLNKIPRATSELFENSVLLLGFSDAPIEMNDLSKGGTKKQPVTLNQRKIKRTTRNRRPVGYRQLARRRPLTAFRKASPRRYLVSNQPHQTIL